MRTARVGSVRFHQCTTVQDDEGRLMCVAGSDALAIRIADLLEEHGLDGADHRTYAQPEYELRP